jgi:hypothetical protein
VGAGRRPAGLSAAAARRPLETAPSGGACSGELLMPPPTMRTSTRSGSAITPAKRSELACTRAALSLSGAAGVAPHAHRVRAFEHLDDVVAPSRRSGEQRPARPRESAQHAWAAPLEVAGKDHPHQQGQQEACPLCGFTLIGAALAVRIGGPETGSGSHLPLLFGCDIQLGSASLNFNEARATTRRG